ncbi:hypothetical protein [Micromonospora sp. WMMD812]|uniref:hypothetical protein n=1 Tax=Micromonospora sp. WMMD812 TaxID=3015152 RepID=UPI00248B5CE6|nr:hypothetical protein [Micromonospora sp. WMMD812]WBB66522.1 hypothetical protein O7603_25750 [Micromonospora sp. WMMD812]
MADMRTTLQFLIMVDGPLEATELLDLIRARLPEAVPYRRDSVDVRGNLLEINPNEGADPRLAATDGDDYLYFRWRVELTPTDRTVDEAHQIALTRELLRAIEGPQVQATVCAAFEDRV